MLSQSQDDLMIDYAASSSVWALKLWPKIHFILLALLCGF